MLQGQIRRYLVKKNYKRLLDQRLALAVAQRNVRAYISLRNWAWWKLFANMKHLLQSAKREEERLAREAEEARLKELERQENERRAALAKELEEANVKLLKEKNELFQELSSVRDVLAEAERAASKLDMQKSDLEARLEEVGDRLADEEQQRGELAKKKKALEAELQEVGRAVDEGQGKLKKTEADVKAKDNQIHRYDVLFCLALGIRGVAFKQLDIFKR